MIRPSFIPPLLNIRYVGIVLLAAGAAYGAWWSFSSFKEGLREEGRNEIRVAIAKADAAATAKQADQNAASTQAHADVVTVTETKYRDRVKEVVKYVDRTKTQAAATGTVACPADAEFVSLYNAAR